MFQTFQSSDLQVGLILLVDALLTQAQHISQIKSIVLETCANCLLVLELQDIGALAQNQTYKIPTMLLGGFLEFTQFG